MNAKAGIVGIVTTLILNGCNSDIKRSAREFKTEDGYSRLIQQNYSIEKHIIIPGTWEFDIESMKLCGARKDYEEFLNWSKAQKTFDYDLLEFYEPEDRTQPAPPVKPKEPPAQPPVIPKEPPEQPPVTPKSINLEKIKKEKDLWWEFKNNERYLVAKNDTFMVNLGIVDFNSIDQRVLKGLTYTLRRISINELPIGTVLGISTTRSDAKLRIDNYYPLISEVNNIPNYNLEATIVTYSKHEPYKKSHSTRTPYPFHPMITDPATTGVVLEPR